MPEMDGLTLSAARYDRNEHQLSAHHPAFTARTSEEDNLEGLGYRCRCYLMKPFSIELLRKKLS